MAGQEPLPKHSVSRRVTGPGVVDMAARYMDEYVAAHCKPATLRIRSAALGKFQIDGVVERQAVPLGQGQGHGQVRLRIGADGQVAQCLCIGPYPTS